MNIGEKDAITGAIMPAGRLLQYEVYDVFGQDTAFHSFHSSIAVDNMIFMGTRANYDSRLVRFRDLENLSSFDYLKNIYMSTEEAKADPDYEGEKGPDMVLFKRKYLSFDQICYNRSTCKLYAICISGQLLATSVIEIDPYAKYLDRSAWNRVVWDKANPRAGTICCDDSYIYTLSSETPHSKICKYAINDRDSLGRMKLINKVQLKNLLSGHSLNIFGDYLYATGQSSPGWIAVVKADNLDLIESRKFEEGENTVTDDVAITDSHVWCGLETLDGKLILVDKQTLSLKRVFTGVMAQCYGTVYDGKSVWVAYNSIPPALVRIDPDDLNMRSIFFSELKYGINEIAIGSNQSLYITTWRNAPAKIVRVYI